MIVRLIGFPALAVCTVLGILGNWGPFAVLVIVLIFTIPLLDALGFHPQERTRIRGWTPWNGDN